MIDHVVVATDSTEIADACAAFGGRAELTSPDHPSGTDRIAEVAERAAYARYDVILNVQGDEPFVTEAQVCAAIDGVRDGFDVGTVGTPVRTLAAWRDPSVVKVVRGARGAALYFSRSPIPFDRDGDPSPSALVSEAYLRHIGVYAYTRAALRTWVRLPLDDLERVERLEQLRPLAAGLKIGVGVVADAEGGVDTPADAVRAEAKLLTLSNTLQPAATE